MHQPGDEMFAKLNKQGVRSDSGFEVQFIDRFAIEYREGIKKITVRMEFGMLGPQRPCVIIRPGALSAWDDEGEGQMLSSSEQQRVLQNFKNGLEALGVPLSIESPM